MDIAVIAGRGRMPVGTDGTGGDKPVVIQVVGVLPPGDGADDVLRVRRTPGAVVAGALIVGSANEAAARAAANGPSLDDLLSAAPRHP